MNIVTVTKDRYTVDPLYQWDSNQTLEIRGLSLPSTPEIHFTNDGIDKAIVRSARMNTAGVITVDVPNGLLQKPYTIKVYVCIYEGGTFKSLYLISIPVKARNKPNDYTIEDDPDIYSFNKLETSVNNALDKCDLAEARYNTAVKLYNASAKKIDGYEARITEYNSRIVKAENTVNEYTAIIDPIIENAMDIINEASNMALMSVGSYSGSNVYGSANQNSLTFDFVPKVIFIISSIFDSKRLVGIIFPESKSGVSWVINGTGTTTLTVLLSEKTVSWYSTSSASTQLNVQTAYRYVAFG